ncbi:MAG: hypothetical protein ABI193_08500, partial [Minicystis sp.]
EKAGVAQRDEAGPTRLRSLVRGVEGVLDRLAEDRVANTLKAENPKGRLLELCMRRRLPAPETTHLESREGHTVELRLTAPEGVFATGPFRASSRLVAEQMAARRLLELWQADEVTAASPVTEAQEEQLKQQNPKGRLLELATRLKVGPPVFTVHPTVSGFVGKGSVPLPNEPALVSGAHAARQARTAEQAAAAALLGALHAWTQGERPKSDEATLEKPAGDPALAATPPRLRGKDPRVQLNEMRQIGLIQGFGFELVEQRGPPHTPIFVTRGYLETAGGERRYTDPLEAKSKKEGEVAVAAPLLSLAIESSQ